MTGSVSQRLTIALAGNPNSGKTTVFNSLTGSRQQIGNWPGVTVEKKEGLFNHRPIEEFLAAPFVSPTQHTSTATSASLKQPQGREIRVVDLPGIYTMSASSEDEAVARDFLLSGEVDLVVNIVDASNIQRNLYLTLQLLEMRVPVLVILNMVDVARKKGITVDAEHLSDHIGCPVVPAAAINSEDLVRIKDAIFRYAQAPRASGINVTYPEALQSGIDEMSTHAADLAEAIGADPRWIGLKLLEGDSWMEKKLLRTSTLTPEDLAGRRAKLEADLGEELDIVIADAKYGYIHGLSIHVTREKLTRTSLTERIDRVVMNRILALPIFFSVMYLVFWITMTVGGAFIDFFDILFGAFLVDGFGYLLTAWSAPAWLVGILAGGVGTGIQTVATFVPIIFTMFVALSVLEDSGYMSRAAYVMDRFMRSIGLPGKSFVPMMVGFGCTVPAILGTRTLESKRDRFMTIFMAPNMSCGARLPVYALFAAAFFPRNSGLIVFSLYLVGILVAVGTGFFLKLTLFRGTPSHFVMELPPYHAPRASFVFGQAWHRLKVFVRRAGITITLIVTVLSVLNTFAIGSPDTGPAASSPGGTDTALATGDEPPASKSVLATFARAVTPAFRPMGIQADNWPATVALFTGIFAKEAVVGTLNSLYGQVAVDGSAEGPQLLQGIMDALRSVPANLAAAVTGMGDPLGASLAGEDEAAVAEEVGADTALFSRLRAHFSRQGAYAYLLFVLIYVPCVAALATAMREMGMPLGWMLAVYSTTVAWSVSTLFYQFSTGPSAPPVLLALGLIVALAIVFRILGSTVYRSQRLERAQ